ncbi:hypothetical protein C8R45DRAFT_946372 [Mycena sanguinolenta]|nr:hypothetical protein C8R45DRAFT_946372 [Mycena sanguinolenta]
MRHGTQKDGARARSEIRLAEKHRALLAVQRQPNRRIENGPRFEAQSTPGFLQQSPRIAKMGIGRWIAARDARKEGEAGREEGSEAGRVRGVGKAGTSGKKGVRRRQKRGRGRGQWENGGRTSREGPDVEESARVRRRRHAARRFSLRVKRSIQRSEEGGLGCSTHIPARLVFMNLPCFSTPALSLSLAWFTLALVLRRAVATTRAVSRSSSPRSDSNSEVGGRGRKRCVLGVEDAKGRERAVRRQARRWEDDDCAYPCPCGVEASFALQIHAGRAVYGPRLVCDKRQYNGIRRLGGSEKNKIVTQRRGKETRTTGTYLTSSASSQMCNSIIERDGAGERGLEVASRRVEAIERRAEAESAKRRGREWAARQLRVERGTSDSEGARAISETVIHSSSSCGERCVTVTGRITKRAPIGNQCLLGGSTQVPPRPALLPRCYAARAPRAAHIPPLATANLDNADHSAMRTCAAATKMGAIGSEDPIRKKCQDYITSGSLSSRDNPVV